MPTTPQHSVTVSDESVCVRVELPLVNKAGEVDLNISPERLHLIVGDVELDMALPHKVKDEEAAAKFDKKAHVLTLTMPRASVSSAPTPMTPPTAPPPAPAPVPAPAPAPAPATKPAAPEPPPKAATSAPTPLPPPPSKPTASSIAPAVATPPTAASASAEVPVEWRQNDQYVALILQVPSVISDSVDAKFEPRRLAMTFRSEPISGAAPHTHKLELQLAGAVNVDGCRYDAADNNMMVVLEKAISGEWPGLEVPVAKAAPAPAPAPATVPASAPAPAPAPDKLLYELD